MPISSPRLNTKVDAKDADRVAEKASWNFLVLLKSITCGVVSLVLMLLFIECFLALNHIGEQEYLKVDPSIGFGHLENKSVTDRSEALGIAKINSAGLTDIEHKLAKTPGTERIAVMGDSITEALQVPLNKRFARVLENDLNSDVKQKFEVINFGVGGFGTGHEYLQFIRDVQPYKPDQVILVYHQGDETESTPDGSRWSLQPTFTLNEDGAPQIRYQEFDTWRKSDSAAPLTLFEWGRRNSHIWQCLLQTHSTLKNEPLYKRITDTCNKLISGTKKLFCRANPVFQESDAAKSKTEDDRVEMQRDELLKEADLERDSRPLAAQFDENSQWALTKKIIEKLNSQCHKDNTKFLIVFVPALEKPLNTRQDFSKKIGELQKLGATEDFATLDLSTMFYTEQKNTTKPIILLAHLSPRGHELVAKKIADYLTNR